MSATLKSVTNNETCQFCHHGDDMSDIAGHLHSEHTESEKNIIAHHRCMQYSSGLVQYKSSEFGGFDVDEVEKEITRGNKLRCFLCKATKGKHSKGASCGCAVKSCRKTFHFPCAVIAPATVTKRLVTRGENAHSNRDVYYRVFCSKDHELMFRQSLKDEVRRGSGENDKSKKERPFSGSIQGGHLADGGSDGMSILSTDATLRSPLTDDRRTSAMMSDVDQLMAHWSISDDASGDDYASIREECHPTSTVNEGKTGSKDGRRSSQFTPIQQPAYAGVSQPPSCSVIEEMGGESFEFFQPDVASQGRSSDYDSTLMATFVVTDEREPFPENSSCNSLAESDKTMIASAGQEVHTQSSLGCRPLPVSGKVISIVCPSNQSDLSAHHSYYSTLVNQLSSVHSPTGFADGLCVFTQTSTGAATPIPLISTPMLHSTQPATSSCLDNSAVVEPLIFVRKADDMIDGRAVMSSSDMAREDEDTGDRHVSSPVCVSVMSDHGDIRDITGYRSRHMRKTVVYFDINSEKFNCRTTAAKGAVVMVPNDMDRFSQLEGVVRAVVGEHFDVRDTEMCVWQHLTLQVLQNQIFVCFVVDLIKQLRNNDTDGVLKLLFDAVYLSSRLSDYSLQCQMFDDIGMEQEDDSLRGALYRQIEKSVTDLPMANLFRTKDGGLVVFSVNLAMCCDNRYLLAHLRAYRGLFRWDGDLGCAECTEGRDSEEDVREVEALTIQVWLSCVTPVTNVTVLPVELMLLDSLKMAAYKEYMDLVHHLKNKTHEAFKVKIKNASVPLLVFQPIDTAVLKFQQYFRKHCAHFLQTEGLQRVLSLMPVCNLHNTSFAHLSSLMESDADGKGGYSVIVRSAFSSQERPTSILLLDVELQLRGVLVSANDNTVI